MYTLSTQKLEWTFTPNYLKLQKQTTLTNSINKIKTISPQELNFLTLEEHEKLVQTYEKKILQLHQRLNFSLQAQASSLIYFKRFFLKHSIFEYDITNIM
jgi:hypothetical protein